MTTRAIKNADAGTYDGECLEAGCGFTSAGWARRKDALARIQQHQDEHDSGEAMPELIDFDPEGD